ncbi:hypothetical protein LSTR_LSTR002855 [Laodelphax striatellus]|uniref:Uncharacterized protein n=1 Tax=Laodelphax striatellus TaxID=195883 RepID=A0A482XI14_LAOST|nr:hypothetical protein LSTR_LSTR002855 [Laodelphax striatellus]
MSSNSRMRFWTRKKRRANCSKTVEFPALSEVGKAERGERGLTDTYLLQRASPVVSPAGVAQLQTPEQPTATPSLVGLVARAPQRHATPTDCRCTHFSRRRRAGNPLVSRQPLSDCV